MEQKVEINVRTKTGYDILFPRTKSEIVDFDITNTRYISDNVQDVLKEIGFGENVPVLSSSWSADAPYTQKIQVRDITSASRPSVGIVFNDDDTRETVKTKTKAWNCVDRIVTSDGFITLYCYNKKPIENFDIFIKGV